MGSLQTTAGKPSFWPSAKWSAIALKNTMPGATNARFSASGEVFFQPKSVPTPMRTNTMSPPGCIHAL